MDWTLVKGIFLFVNMGGVKEDYIDMSISNARWLLVAFGGWHLEIQ
jgi:hypothetical protein